jgi:SAM-dependent methyltransferase
MRITIKRAWLDGWIARLRWWRWRRWHRPIRDPWLDVLIASLTSPQRSPFGDQLPDFPSEELQRNTTGLSSEVALRQAFAFYSDVKRALHRAGQPLTRESRVLDFGFGWGRIARVFMQDVPVGNINGIDVDPEFVSLTRRLFKGGQFDSCAPLPPTSFAPDSFDLVFAYSVFSHLSEKAANAWMGEFARILKPGGVVVFTTRHESFFDFCASAATLKTEDSYLLALGKLLPDPASARSRFRAGEIVHATSAGVSGGGSRDASFYGETWIPESVARAGFGVGLEFVAGYFDGSRYDQACFALRRKP